ncbi:hypothetical protein ACWKYD_06430 [Enterobacter cloacae]
MVNYNFNEPVRIADFCCKKYPELVVKIEQFRLRLLGVTPALITGTVSGWGKNDPDAQQFSYRWLPPQVIGGRQG